MTEDPKSYKPRPETLERFRAARKQLIAELRQADPKVKSPVPTAQQLAERLEISVARVYQLLAAADLPTRKAITPKRADLSRPISKAFVGLERVVARNLRRLYKAELDKPEPRSDAELGKLAGYERRPDQNAVEFRKWIEAQGRAPSLLMLERLAAAFGVEVEELVRKP